MTKIVKIISLSLLIFLTSLTFPMAEPAPVKGIYSLMKGMEPVAQSVLRIPFVAGVSIRAQWMALEPEEGKFDWSYLDQVLQEVKKVNKKAMIRVLPGVSSPQWIYNRGTASIRIQDPNPHHKTYGQRLQIPVPWDNTYLGYWNNLVQALGKRYGSDSTIELVHIAGPTLASAEFHLPKQGEGKRMMEEKGYLKEKLVAAWRKVIDAYSTAFPNTSLALNISIPLKNDGAMEEIIDYGISRLGPRLCVQGNWLSAHTNDSFHLYNVILGLKKNSPVTIGFQMLGAGKNESRMGSLDTAIQKGLKAGAKYFEIYQVDITDRRYNQLFEELDKKLK